MPASNDGAEQAYGCVPNGGIGISVVTRGACFIQAGNEWQQQASMFVYGLVKSVQWHRITAGYREVTIVFKPHHLQSLLKTRLADLPEHAAIPLEELFAASDTGELYERLCAATTDEEITAAVRRFIDAQATSDTTGRLIGAAHGLICQHKVRKVDELSSRLNISCTGLRTLFRDKMGIAPKELIKVRRINEAFRVREHKEQTLAGLAYRLDYFDQAHFIHDFKDVMGLTPRQYFRNERLTADFYNYGRWDRSSFDASCMNPQR